MIRRLTLTALALLAALFFAQPAMGWSSSNPTSGPGNPLAGKPWFVDWQDGMSQRQVLSYVSRGDRSLNAILFGGGSRPNTRSPVRALQTFPPSRLIEHVRSSDRANAQAIIKIARNPQTRRITGATADPRSAVADYVRRAEAAAPGSLSFIYAYGFAHVYRDPQRRLGSTCGGFDAGRAADAAYKRWIGRLAAGIGSGRAAVFLEPDGVMTMKCLSRRGKSARYSLLNYGIRTLNALPNTTVYVDAGHSGWFSKKGSIRTKVAMMRRAGVLKARGFFLNSTGYHRTSREVAHGNKLVKMLGGKPRFVVSTAVNGNGPYVIRGRRLRYPAEQRCNPPGRALGNEPTVRTSSRFADAYVWIGDPGRAGGRCPHPGQPTSPGGGQWWEWYAAMLGRNARWK